MMSLDWMTVARPYAKAVFELAVSQKTLKLWSEILAKLAMIVEQRETMLFIKRPDILPEQVVELCLSVLEQPKNETVTHFVQLLAKANRLGALPAIQHLYEELHADYEKTVEVKVLSFESLTDTQEKTLSIALKKRLNRDVHLTVQIDKSLLGGVIVRAGDLVIDGSVQGKLHRLNDEMMK